MTTLHWAKSLPCGPLGRRPFGPRLWPLFGQLSGPLCALLFTAGAHAHDAWLEPAGADWAVKFGDNWKAEPYPAAKVTALRVMAANGQVLAVTRTVTDSEVRATVAGDAALLALTYDNGMHSRAGSGKAVEMPMTQLPGATSGVHALKWHKTIVQWSAVVNTPVGQALEIVPTQTAAPRAGQPSQWLLLLDGKPLPGAEWGTGELALRGRTDAQGRFEFVPSGPGRQRLWVGHRIQVQDDPRFTQLSHAATLIFDVR